MKLLDNIELLITAEYSTMFRMRQLILNIYNPDIFPEVDIQKLIRCTDEQHYELFQDIIHLTNTECGYVAVIEVGTKILEHNRGN